MFKAGISESVNILPVYTTYSLSKDGILHGKSFFLQNFEGMTS